MRDEERQAFLAAIVASPDDDLPRLIYADRLDESGDPRGDFIRLQLELADALPELPVVDTDHLPPITEGADGLFHSEGRDFGSLPALREGAEVDLRFPGGVARGWRVYQVGAGGRIPGPAAAPYVVRSCGEPRLWSTAEGVARKLMPRARYDALRQRERELLKAASRQWIEDGYQWLPKSWPFDAAQDGTRMRWDWRRGFVAEVTCPWDDWYRHHKAILNAAPLERVVPTTWPEWEGDSRGDEYLRLRGCNRWHRIPFADLPNGSARATIVGKLLAAEWPKLDFDLSRLRRVGFDPAQPGDDGTVTGDVTWEPNAREWLVTHNITIG